MCERPGCGAVADASYGIDRASRRGGGNVITVGERESTGRLCRRHANALTVPNGWTLDDRRDTNPKRGRGEEGEEGEEGAAGAAGASAAGAFGASGAFSQLTRLKPRLRTTVAREMRMIFIGLDPVLINGRGLGRDSHESKNLATVSLMFF